MADDQIDAPVVVEVAQGNAARQVCRAEVRAAVLRNVLKLAAFIAEQNRALSGIAAVAGGMTDGMAGGDDKIFPAVMINIQKARAPTDGTLPQRSDTGGAGGVVEK